MKDEAEMEQRENRDKGTDGEEEEIHKRRPNRMQGNEEDAAATAIQVPSRLCRHADSLTQRYLLTTHAEVLLTTHAGTHDPLTQRYSSPLTQVLTTHSRRGTPHHYSPLTQIQHLNRSLHRLI